MRKSDLINRIKLSYKFIRHGKGKCRIMTCGKCGSTAITPITNKPIETKCIDEKHHIDLIYADFNQCMVCGAVCYEMQQWNFEGDAEKLGTGVIASVTK